MALLENLLARFGYVKLSSYGMTLSPQGYIVPQTAAPRWRSQSGWEMPLPAPSEDRAGGPAQVATPAAASVVTAVATATAGGEDDDWDRLLAQARARVEAESLAIEPPTLVDPPLGAAPEPLRVRPDGTPAPRPAPALPRVTARRPPPPGAPGRPTPLRPAA